MPVQGLTDPSQMGDSSASECRSADALPTATDIQEVGQPRLNWMKLYVLSFSHHDQLGGGMSGSRPVTSSSSAPPILVPRAALVVRSTFVGSVLEPAVRSVDSLFGTRLFRPPRYRPTKLIRPDIM